MKLRLAAAFGLALTLLAAGPTFAATRIVTLSVPGMMCPSCPVTVRKALGHIHGVRVVSTDLSKRTLKVEIKDAHVTDREITSATANAGFPSTVVKAAHS